MVKKQKDKRNEGDEEGEEFAEFGGAVYDYDEDEEELCNCVGCLDDVCGVESECEVLCEACDESDEFVCGVDSGPMFFAPDLEGSESDDVADLEEVEGESDSESEKSDEKEFAAAEYRGLRDVQRRDPWSNDRDPWSRSSATGISSCRASSSATKPLACQ